MGGFGPALNQWGLMTTMMNIYLGCSHCEATQYTFSSVCNAADAPLPCGYSAGGAIGSVQGFLWNKNKFSGN